jgi:hypothetical protein
MPAAGPGASGVLRLLRPAPSRSAEGPDATPVVAVEKQARLHRNTSSLAEASFSMSAATLEAAAASVFGPSKHIANSVNSNAAVELQGLSCVIGARGEVSAFLFIQNPPPSPFPTYVNWVSRKSL